VESSLARDPAEHRSTTGRTNGTRVSHVFEPVLERFELDLAAQKSVPIFAIGLGADVKDDVLTRMATDTSGPAVCNVTLYIIQSLFPVFTFGNNDNIMSPGNPGNKRVRLL